MDPNDRFEFHPIAHIRTPFGEKFGVPRQPGLVPAAHGRIELLADFATPEALAELAGFSHLWIVFVFDRVPAGEWHPTVRPPRLGGNRRVGVFASRSPFRPNPIGLSVVKIESVLAAQSVIEVSGVDLVDGTAVIDLKPYVPYCDAIADADPGYATVPQSALADLPIEYPAAVADAIDKHPDGTNFRLLLEQVLRADPRPSYHDNPDKIYGMSLGGRNVRFSIQAEKIIIKSLELTN